MWAAVLGYCERNPAEVERCASDLIELTTRHHFAHYMAAGAVYCGWARSVRAEPGGVEVRRSREKTRGHAGYRQRIKRQKKRKAGVRGTFPNKLWLFPESRLEQLNAIVW